MLYEIARETQSKIQIYFLHTKMSPVILNTPYKNTAQYQLMLKLLTLAFSGKMPHQFACYVSNSKAVAHIQKQWLIFHVKYGLEMQWRGSKIYGSLLFQHCLYISHTVFRKHQFILYDTVDGEN
jgi:hypothetical protein